MGYIFDALNRGGHPPDDREPRPADEQPPVEPQATTGPPPDSPDSPGAPACADPAERDPSDSLTNAADHDAQIPENVPQVPDDNLDDRLVAMLQPASIMAEEYRAIRTGLLARWKHKRQLVHTITSATPQEGKTLTSLNLGLSFAELRNRRTLVVEADLRLPQFEKLLGIEQSKGLTDLLAGEADVDEVIQQVGPNRLHVITAGPRANDRAVEMLSRNRMAALMKTLRGRYDHLIMDTPPVIELADAGILGTLSDEVLMVVRMNRTPKALVDQAIRTLESYNAPVAGLIATDQKPRRRRYYYYRYGYGYGHHYHYRYYSDAA